LQLHCAGLVNHSRPLLLLQMFEIHVNVNPEVSLLASHFYTVDGCNPGVSLNPGKWLMNDFKSRILDEEV